jgi:hypothetical protein
MAAIAQGLGRVIAAEFRTRFPTMYVEYKQRCADGRFRLGDVFMWSEGDYPQIGLPRIGAGLGRLAWRDVRALLENVGGESNVALVVFEEFSLTLP